MTAALTLLKLFARPLTYLAVALAVYFAITGKARETERQRLETIAEKAKARELKRQLDHGTAALEEARARALSDRKDLTALKRKLEAERTARKHAKAPQRRDCRLGPDRVKRLRLIR